MSNITRKDLDKCFKPFDIVKTKKGGIAFITEVAVSETQDDFIDKFEYSLKFIDSKGSEYESWYNHDELSYVGNLMILFAECMASSCGENAEWIDKIFNFRK